MPGGGGDAGLEDPVGRGDRFHDSETNDREEDVMDAEGQDDSLSQSLLTGIGLDAEDPSDEVPGLSPNVGEEPRLVLQDQLTDSLDLQLSPEPMSLKLGEKHDIDEVFHWVFHWGNSKHGVSGPGCNNKDSWFSRTGLSSREEIKNCPHP